MNFLAHIYLSGNNANIMVGNFIGDFVKGRNLLEQFDPEIAVGIELHRFIDEFTDSHPVVRKSKVRLRSKYHHYAPVIVDVYYDHFLSRYWSNYSNEPLTAYSNRIYGVVRSYWDILPNGIRFILPYMIRDNWLLNYGTFDGIEKTLRGMTRRSKYDSRMDESLVDLKEHYDDFLAEFEDFFPSLSKHADEFIREVNKI